jgi:hypothetical protein
VPVLDRRQGDRRTPGRRMQDRIAREREQRRLRLADPVALAVWEMQMEATARQDRERLERLRTLARGFKYGTEGLTE